MPSVFEVVSCRPNWPGRSMHFLSVHLIVASVICRPTKIYTIGAIAEKAHTNLFKKMMSRNHCIHFCCRLLSPAGIASEIKNIHMSSPDVNMNYIKILLFFEIAKGKHWIVLSLFCF